MTSVLSHLAQVPAFAFYIVENNGGYMINIAFDDFINLDDNTVLADMGKTIVTNGFIYRKVQIVSQNGNLIAGGATGYICLNCDRITIGENTEDLGIHKLN